MNIVFLCLPKYLQVASTMLRAVQLHQIVKGPLADQGYDVFCTTDPNLDDSFVVLSKGFLVDADAEAVDALRGRRNIVVADYIDRKPDPLISTMIDGFMASSYRQHDHLQSTFPDKPCHLVTHHVDQRIGQVFPPADRLRVGYFGEVFNARYATELRHLIEFISTDTRQSEGRWITALTNYNCHYGLRAIQSWDGFKPFLKGFTAAHCGAPIVTELAEGDAAYYLPHDYPYLFSDDAEGVAESIRQMAASFGGPNWNYACEVMREVRERSSVTFVVKEFEAMVFDHVGPRARTGPIRRTLRTFLGSVHDWLRPRPAQFDRN